MKCTSIIHRQSGSNFQTDFAGSKNDCLAFFERECSNTQATWGHLFDEQTGYQVATYNQIQGMTTLA